MIFRHFSLDRKRPRAVGVQRATCSRTFLRESRTYTIGYNRFFTYEDDEYGASSNGEFLNQTGYIALELVNGSDTHYRWVRVTTSNVNTENNATMIIHDWACNSTPGDPISAGQGIRINCVLPRGMKTPMTQREIDERGNEELLEKELELLPMGRLEDPGSDRDDSASPYSVDTNPRQLPHWLRGPTEGRRLLQQERFHQERFDGEYHS